MSDKTPAKMGRPRAYTTPQEMHAVIQEYFQKWESEDRPLTMAGLICYLDICEDTFGEYSSGKYDDFEYEDYWTFSDTIKKSRKYIENSKLENALLGKYNPSVSIFDLKNNHGYSDKSEVKNYDMTPTVISDDIDDE